MASSAPITSAAAFSAKLAPLRHSQTRLAATANQPANAAVRSNPPEASMNVDDVARAIVYMDSLSLEANVQFMTIMATKMPQSPQNKAETILADADLEYLGSGTVEEKAEDLYKELQHLNPTLTKAQWLKTQISFLQAHRYRVGFFPGCTSGHPYPEYPFAGPFADQFGQQLTAKNTKALCIAKEIGD